MLTATDLNTGNFSALPTDGRLVVCLCAEWCGTCRTYREEFEALSEQFPGHIFIWIDVEDDSEWAGDIDVENFPTLLVTECDAVQFAGVMLPHIGHLERLLGALSASSTKPPVDEAFRKAASRFWATLTG